MRKVEQGDFITSRDIVDSIRLETSTVPPQLQETLGRLVKEFSYTLVDKYGIFMPKTRVQVSDGIEHRLLLLEKEFFRIFYDTWVPREERSGYPVAGVFRKGRITVLLDPYESWTDIPEEEKGRFIEFFGSEEDAREEVMLGNLTNNIAHETVHHYQDWSLPEVFLELGTRYYQREIMQGMGYDYGGDGLNTRRFEFYRTLLEKPWGGDVHRLYFGALKSPYPKDVVLGLVGADFFPQSPLLFPTGYGSRKR